MYRAPREELPACLLSKQEISIFLAQYGIDSPIATIKRKDPTLFVLASQRMLMSTENLGQLVTYKNNPQNLEVDEFNTESLILFRTVRLFRLKIETLTTL